MVNFTSDYVVSSSVETRKVNRKIKVLCIYTLDNYFSTEQPLETAEEIPFGISIIATVLEKKGADVDLLVLTEASFKKTLDGYFSHNSPELICLTSVSSQFRFVSRISIYIRYIGADAFILLGGHHASLAPEDAIAVDAIDAICVGEGDYSIQLLLEILDNREEVTGIPHFWVKHGEELEKNVSFPFNQNLDLLPFINRNMWEQWVAFPDINPAVLVGRGCPYRCTYCSNHAMKKISNGRYVRYRSAQNIINEICEICYNNPNIMSMYLEVETIGADIDSAIELFTSLELFNSNREKPIMFSMNLAYHSNFSKDDRKLKLFLEKCCSANVRELSIGLESGSERIRKDILRRPKHSNAELHEFLLLVKGYGIKINLFLLIGVPGETPADFRHSIAFVRKSNPDFVLLSIFFPYVGTDLYEAAIEQKLISDNNLDSSNERSKSVLSSPDYSAWKIKRDYILFWYNAYHGKWSYIKILLRTVKSVIYTTPIFQTAYKTLLSKSSLFLKVRDRLK